MVLVRRLLRAASPNQWRGGARVGPPCTRAVRRHAKWTDGRIARKGGIARRPLCLFVLFGRVVSDGDRRRGARRAEWGAIRRFVRTGHVSALLAVPPR